MKVGIQYFAKGCLYSFYFTNPILSPETKVVSYVFFCFVVAYISHPHEE